MKTTVLSRRGVLKTLLFSVLAGTSSRIYAGGLLVRSNFINWIDGCIMPRYTSESFGSAKANVLKAVAENQRTYTGAQTTLTYINDLPNGSTVEQLLLHKQSQGVLSFETQLFEGMGHFIKKLNGISHSPSQTEYWKFRINNVVSQSGISQTILNDGDIVSFTLGSALNDQIAFVDSLGDYSKVLISDQISLWNGKPLSQNDWPNERGSVWYEFCTIDAPSTLYFVPNQIEYTRYIERWDIASQSWIIISTISSSTSANDFIGQSWNQKEETTFDQPSTRMIFGGVGTGFSPLQGTSEMTRLANRLAWLQIGKIRIRTAIKVTLVDLQGNSQLITSEKFSLKESVPFTKGEQPLQILSLEKTLFTAPTEQEGLLYELEKSSNLIDWDSGPFMSNQANKEILVPKQSRLFQRIRRF